MYSTHHTLDKNIQISIRNYFDVKFSAANTFHEFTVNGNKKMLWMTWKSRRIEPKLLYLQSLNCSTDTFSSGVRLKDIYFYTRTLNRCWTSGQTVRSARCSWIRRSSTRTGPSTMRRTPYGWYPFSWAPRRGPPPRTRRPNSSWTRPQRPSTSTSARLSGLRYRTVHQHIPNSCAVLYSHSCVLCN